MLKKISNNIATNEIIKIERTEEIEFSVSFVSSIIVMFGGLVYCLWFPLLLSLVCKILMNISHQNLPVLEMLEQCLKVKLM